MKLSVDDIKKIREQAVNMYIDSDPRLYIDGIEVAEKDAIARCYIQATIDQLGRLGGLKESVEINIGRKSTDGIEDIS